MPNNTDLKSPELTDSKGRAYTIEYIDFDSLDSLGSLSQITARYDGAAVEEYAAIMKAQQWDWERFESFPVLFREVEEIVDEDDTVTSHRTHYWIGDGHHTIDAANHDDRTAIRCKVYEGNLTDAKCYSFREANRYHGVRLTNAQKRSIVEDTLSDRDMLRRIAETVTGCLYDDIPSDQLIAAYLNEVASTATVASVWQGLVDKDPFDQFTWLRTAKRLGQDGKRQKCRSKAQTSETPVEPIATVPKLEATTTAEPLQKPSIDEQETDDNPSEEAEFLPGFEGISSQAIKEIAFKHSEEITSSLLELFDIPNDANLFEELLKSIKKTITEYRDKERSDA